MHDLFEEIPETQVEEISQIDEESPEVLKLVFEVKKKEEETKPEFLKRILEKGSVNALLLKCADRICNLTDLHSDTHTNQKISEYLDHTE